MTQANKLPRRDVGNELARVRQRNDGWIRLRDCDLSTIPEEVFALKQLEIVDLSGNDLTTVPERLWDLPNLKGVNLIGNPIESLPNRPGLTIDLPIYRRCRGEVEPKNIELVIGADTSEDDAAFWISELETSSKLNRLTIVTGPSPSGLNTMSRVARYLKSSTRSLSWTSCNPCRFAGSV